MKYKFTLLHILLLFTLAASAQNLTGIWRGHFAQNSFGFYEDRYKFEVQIDQAANDGLRGVTYSYKTTVFYGKATLQGIYSAKTKELTINEVALVELKMEGQSQACLMTCYLEYSKMGNLETLTGTYSSRYVKGKGDCGGGKVYLERTTTSDFYKEDFLTKKDNEKKKLQDIVKRPNTRPLNVPPKTTPNVVTGKNPDEMAKVRPRIKPGAEDALTKNDKPVLSNNSSSNTPSVKEQVAKPNEETIKPRITEKPVVPKPEVIKKRNNELVKKIYTSSHDIKIQLYDNGDIDGDTITVYHNNELIVSRKRLTDKAITFAIQADETNPRHEFVMVAENLGSIPPNTALMVITAGSRRYELFITSTEQKNAVVVLEYRPDEKP